MNLLHIWSYNFFVYSRVWREGGEMEWGGSSVLRLHVIAPFWHDKLLQSSFAVVERNFILIYSTKAALAADTSG